VQPGAVLFFPLLSRKHFTAKCGKLGELLLNFLEPVLPLTVSDMGRGFIPLSQPVLFVRISDLGNFRSQRPYFLSQNFKMIHSNRIAHLDSSFDPKEKGMVPPKVLNLMTFAPARHFELSSRFYRDLETEAVIAFAGACALP
jgi:hypothetical protein